MGGGVLPYAFVARRSDLLVHGHLLPLHSQSEYVNSSGNTPPTLALRLLLIHSGPQLTHYGCVSTSCRANS